MRIGVIGLGSAGIFTLCHLLTYLRKDVEIVSIHDPKINIVGIGESTNPAFLSALEEAVNFNIIDHGECLDATPKFGTRYKNWRTNPIVNPLIGGSFAIHFNTYKLKDFIMPRLRSRFSNFKEKHGNVEFLENQGHTVKMILDGKEEFFDYIIDCRGFPKDYSDYTICDIPVNHCLVHNIREPGNWNYTGHRATRNGWMFEVPLQSRQSYGYLFNDQIVSKEEALEDFSREIGVDKNDLDNIEYCFKSYYCNKAFDGRILKNGNSVTFFEPMFANSLWIYNSVIRYFLDYLHNKQITPDDVNKEIAKLGDQVEHMIYYFYHGGSTYDSKFWDHAVSNAKKKLSVNTNLKRCIEEFEIHRGNGFNNAPAGGLWVFNGTALDIIDREFGYNYFKGKKFYHEQTTI